MRFAAQMFVKLLNEYPTLETAAFLIVGWVGVNCSSIAIGPCDQKIVMSFKVPEKMLRGEKCECEIISKQFVSRVMSANHLEFGKTYRFSGIFNADKNKVIFAISDMASYKL